MNTYNYCRQTNETQFEVILSCTKELEQASQIDTGVGFFDHLLTLMAFHGGFQLTVRGKGDLEVDSHHTVEDVGICFGTILRQMAIEKQNKGMLPRYGDILLPMDEALVRVVIDVSGRGGAYTTLPFTVEKIGSLETEMIREFFIAIAQTGRLTLHADILKGVNNHHMAEALFKGLGRCIRSAFGMDAPGIQVMGGSTKGMLELEELQ